MTDFLSDLLPEMCAEVRRWLSIVDRVRLQRVSRQCHARDPGCLLVSKVWRYLGKICLMDDERRGQFTAAVAAGLHERVPPTQIELGERVMTLSWYQIPVTEAIHGAIISEARVQQIEISRNGTPPLTKWSKSTEVISRGVPRSQRIERAVHGCSSDFFYDIGAPAMAMTFVYGNLFAMLCDDTFNEAFQHRGILCTVRPSTPNGSPLYAVWDIPLGEERPA